jgi:hypothetical protein
MICRAFCLIILLKSSIVAARTLLAAAILSCAACSVVNQDKGASFESQNRILREQNGILQGELAEKQQHERELAQRLSQAEIELARQQQPDTTRR